MKEKSLHPRVSVGVSQRKVVEDAVVWAWRIDASANQTFWNKLNLKLKAAKILITLLSYRRVLSLNQNATKIDITTHRRFSKLQCYLLIKFYSEWSISWWKYILTCFPGCCRKDSSQRESLRANLRRERMDIPSTTSSRRRLPAPDLIVRWKDRIDPESFGLSRRDWRFLWKYIFFK